MTTKFDDLVCYYLEPYLGKSIGIWGKQLVDQLHPTLIDFPEQKRSLKRNYIEHGHFYAEWFRKAITQIDFDVLLFSEAFNYAHLYSSFPKYFRYIPSIMFVHCLEVNFASTLRSPANMYGEFASLELATRVCFFSEASRRMAFDNLTPYLSTAKIQQLVDKSVVVDLPYHFQDIEKSPMYKKVGKRKVLLNHRLDPDKNYIIVLETLLQLLSEGEDFQVILCGAPSGSKAAAVVHKYLNLLGDRVLFYGFVSDRKDYVHWLELSDIVVCASTQETFGISVLEAVRAGCTPLVANSGSFKDIFRNYPEFTFSNEIDLKEKLRLLLRSDRAAPPSPLVDLTDQYDWIVGAPKIKQLVVDTYNIAMAPYQSPTNTTTRVIDRLRQLNTPVTKNKLLTDFFQWGSFDFWPSYRTRLLLSGVKYDRTNHTYEVS